MSASLSSSDGILILCPVASSSGYLYRHCSYSIFVISPFLSFSASLVDAAKAQEAAEKQAQQQHRQIIRHSRNSYAR